jgi:hypothetical protein
VQPVDEVGWMTTLLRGAAAAASLAQSIALLSGAGAYQARNDQRLALVTLLRWLRT